MRRLGLKTGIVFCAVLLALALGTSAALAYFSDYEPAKGKVTYRMGSQITMDEGTDEKEKNIVLKNEGEGNVEFIARVKAYGPENYTTVTCDEEYWYKGEDGWYYYKYILAPGQTTKPDTLNARIEVKGPDGEALSGDELKKAIAALGDGFKVTVVHQSEIVKYKQEGDKNVVDAPSGWEYQGFKAAE